MTIFLGFILQLAISGYLILFGWAASTNLGFSDAGALEKIVGLALISIGAYGIYDLSTMFNYTG